ncbi:hypothetical protein RIF29_40653 [Crotalaria pallida]|uniref:Uncharacterized protein n=1 Tax=Crotalaria pallida TaxID=3830 RepID=A0AAN9E5X2_CROPI
MEEDVEENNSNEICQGKSCDSVLTPKSGDNYVKSTGSRSALSDLTNTINANLLHWNEENNANFEGDRGTNIGHNIAQNMDAKLGVQITKRMFVHQLHLEILIFLNVNGSNFQEDNQLRLDQDFVIETECLHCSQENSANFEGEVGTKISHDIPQDSYATPITRRSDNKENVCTSTGLGNIDIPRMKKFNFVFL